MTSYFVGHQHNRNQDLDGYDAATPLEAAQRYLNDCGTEELFEDIKVRVVENLFEDDETEQFFEVVWPGPKVVAP